MCFFLSGCAIEESKERCTEITYSDEIIWPYVLGGQVGFDSSIEKIKSIHPNNFDFDYAYDPEETQKPNESMDFVLLAKADTTFGKAEMSRSFEYSFIRDKLIQIETEFYPLQFDSNVFNDYMATQKLFFLLQAKEMNKCYTFRSAQYIIEFSKYKVSLLNGKKSIGYKIKVRHQ